jgi:hypothetical protein
MLFQCFERDTVAIQMRGQRRGEVNFKRNSKDPESYLSADLYSNVSTGLLQNEEDRKKRKP